MRTPSGQTLKRWSIKAVFSLAGIVLAAVFGQFFIELADQYGFYKNPSGKLVAVFDFVLQSQVVRIAGSAILGFAAGVWVESLAQRKELESPTPQPAQPTTSKTYKKVSVIAKARQMAATIRQALKNRDFRDAYTYYQQFQDEAADARDTLMRGLDGVPPIDRHSNAPAAYWNPGTPESLAMVATDLELLADAVEEKLGSV